MSRKRESGNNTITYYFFLLLLFFSFVIVNGWQRCSRQDIWIFSDRPIASVWNESNAHTARLFRFRTRVYLYIYIIYFWQSDFYPSLVRRPTCDRITLYHTVSRVLYWTSILLHKPTTTCVRHAGGNVYFDWLTPPPLPERHSGRHWPVIGVLIALRLCTVRGR